MKNAKEMLRESTAASPACRRAASRNVRPAFEQLGGQPDRNGRRGAGEWRGRAGRSLTALQAIGSRSSSTLL